MSFFLEFLKCILCCEDEYIDAGDDEATFSDVLSRIRINNPISRRISTHLDESYSIPRYRNHPQDDLRSSLLNTTRNESTWLFGPMAAEYRVILGSEPSNPTSVKLYHPSVEVERIYEVPQNPRKPVLTPTPSSRFLKVPTSSPTPAPSSKPSSIFSKPNPSPAAPSSPPSDQLPYLKPTVSIVPSESTEQPEKGKYKREDPKDTLPIYMIPKDIVDLIKRDIVPEVLEKPLSPSTFRDYFAALLYAEDYYIEKWSNFELSNVSLELQPASIYQKSGRKNYSNASDEIDTKTFVVFKVDPLSKKRPFLLSRDFVFAQPCGKKVDPFQGVIYRVVKSTTILVEFEEKFHSQHTSTRRYNISFSFNRVCLKRAHQAIAAASAPCLNKFIFPYSVSNVLVPSSSSFKFYNSKLDQKEKLAVHRILNLRSPPPFVVKGPLCGTGSDKSTSFSKQLSRTVLLIKEAILQIYCRDPGFKVLVCAPTNSTCDLVMRSLKMEISESDMFRANAAFREREGVPIDIFPSCLYKEETDCFACPSIRKLRNFRVIFSTFISSYRLYNAGVTAGHFNYIFLVDASSAIEPETMVALANLAGKSTAVVVTGAPGNRSSYVRSDIAREKGLRLSYFERLCEFDPYKNGNPMFTVQLGKSTS